MPRCKPRGYRGRWCRGLSFWARAGAVGRWRSPRSLAGLAGSQDEARFALLRHESGLAGGGEEHEVGFPVSEGAPTVDGGGPQGDGNTAFDEIVGRRLVAAMRR